MSDSSDDEYNSDEYKAVIKKFVEQEKSSAPVPADASSSDASSSSDNDSDSDSDSDTSSSSSDESESDAKVSASEQVPEETKKVEVETKTEDAPPKKKPFWAPKHIAFMKGLPYSAAPDEIKNFFADCGEIVSVTRQLGDDGRWNGCVFVKFTGREHLDTALTLDGTIWTGEGGGMCSMNSLYRDLCLLNNNVNVCRW
jgi:nucleolin